MRKKKERKKETWRSTLDEWDTGSNPCPGCWDFSSMRSHLFNKDGDSCMRKNYGTGRRKINEEGERGGWVLKDMICHFKNLWRDIFVPKIFSVFWELSSLSSTTPLLFSLFLEASNISFSRKSVCLIFFWTKNYFFN